VKDCRATFWVCQETNGFNDLSSETDTQEEMTSQYCNKSRRWICASMKLSSGRYRKTWVLVDTGAVGYYLRAADRVGLTECEVSTVLRDDTLYCTENFLGNSVRFRKSENAANENIHDINVIGANFLNDFLIIDDYQSNYLKLIKRADIRAGKISRVERKVTASFFMLHANLVV
jgi:hypothetical protein